MQMYLRIVTSSGSSSGAGVRPLISPRSPRAMHSASSLSASTSLREIASGTMTYPSR